MKHSCARWRWVPALLLVGSVSPLAGQGAQGAQGAQAALAPVRWSFEGNRGSYCISYLVDPDLVRELVPASVATTLAPAGTGEGLHPFLARTVQDEPKFATWIPASICVGYYDRVTAGGATLAQGKGGRPVIIITNSLATRGGHTAGGDSSSAYLLDLLTDQRPLQRAAADLGFDIDNVTVSSRVRIEGDDPEVLMTVNGAGIIWSGHATGASSVGKTRRVSFGYAGRRSSNWRIEAESTPESSRLMVGALQVVGTNALAKALRASPVRAVGPEERGGSSILVFQRETHQPN